MSHTVGISGVNGNLGQQVLKHLAKAALDDKIKLIVFHRKANLPKGVEASKDIELRILDYDGPTEEVEKAIEGVNIFISTVGFSGIPQEIAVVNALANSPAFVTYLPATYSIPWTEEDYEDARLGPILKFIHAGWDRAKELGIAVTPVYTSIFDVYWFNYGFLNSSLGSGEIVANEKHLENRLPFTSLDHLGQTITHIATSDPNSVKNQKFYCVTFWPTGNELVALHEKLTGKTVVIKEYTPAYREEQMADAENFGPTKVGYWDRWETDSFNFDKQDGWLKHEYRGPGLEEIGKQFT